MKKPCFNSDQLNSVSNAVKRFGKIRKKAKENPQFISENNKIDTVILDYNQYEKMFDELETLREIALEYEVERRIEKANSNPKNSLPLSEIVGKEDYQKYKSMDPNSISDEDLFEK